MDNFSINKDNSSLNQYKIIKIDNFNSALNKCTIIEIDNENFMVHTDSYYPLKIIFKNNNKNQYENKKIQFFQGMILNDLVYIRIIQ